MNEFKTCHPMVNFLYFFLVIGFTMFLMHPVSLGITLFCAILYSFVLKGKRKALKSIGVAVFVILITAILNPLFSHYGVTVITYLPTGNPLTAESICYGIAAGVMLSSVLLYFSCFNMVLSSDKFTYLFGRIIPKLSMVFSMIIRFVPTLISRLKEISAVQKTLGRDISKGGIIKRVKCGIKILSVLITWSLENAIETADSMKSRGYGLSGRTSYTIFKLEKRDKLMLLSMGILSAVILWGILSGKLNYSYFPVLYTEKLSFLSLCMHTAYLFLCLTPVLLEWREAIRWNVIKSKI
ncbi:MAG: energy-coupling factor transporter transmembrane protein EcfT [Clostridia bacterium]|nr:energy-coupling factor transporter transmembrane protein EcfT [Clostridia bacterium]